MKVIWVRSCFRDDTRYVKLKLDLMLFGYSFLSVVDVLRWVVLLLKPDEVV